MIEQKTHAANPIGSINKKRNNTTCLTNVVFLTNHKVSKNGKLKIANASKKLKKYSIIIFLKKFNIHIETHFGYCTKQQTIHHRWPAEMCLYMVPQGRLELPRLATLASKTSVSTIPPPGQCC